MQSMVVSRRLDLSTFSATPSRFELLGKGGGGETWDAEAARICASNPASILHKRKKQTRMANGMGALSDQSREFRECETI